MLRPLTRSRLYRTAALALSIALVGTLIPPVVQLPAARAAPIDRRSPSPPPLVSPSPRPPLSVSRVQSAYTPADTLTGTLTITFTVTNHRPPTTMPRISESATLTETAAALETFDAAADPNTVHDVLLADALTAGATFVSASPRADHEGGEYTWNLGDVPPAKSLTATLTLSVPTSVADVVALDAGATAWGTLGGQAVRASACPITLAPDSLGQYLQPTVDADFRGQYVAKRAGQLCPDPERAFEYARTLGYEAYEGSLRGARGTEWSQAGNSLDQTNLLIATLRGSGTPARYRHGTLSTERARELILSMFPTTGAVVGYVPQDVEVSDPAHDPELLAEARDHWWVEAYLPGPGWTNLDPSFAGASVGDVFVESVAADGSDRIAEVPDELRHKVTMKVKVERAESIAALIPNNLPVSYPLTHTFNTVELVGESVTLGHLVNTEGQTGAVFYNLQHTYVPYFALGDFETAIEGEPFQELVSNFPFGTSTVTDEWLLFDVRDTDGNVERYEREGKVASSADVLRLRRLAT